jgi:hypothetical protein
MSEVKPPPQKFGHPCLACRQWITPLSVRIPVKNAAKKLVGFRHAGCSLAKTT